MQGTSTYRGRKDKGLPNLTINKFNSYSKMTDKIDELTQKIYNEGVLQAKEQADLILSDAKRNAAESLESANKKSNEIIVNAEKKAQEREKLLETELKQASQKFMEQLKQRITSVISNEIIVNSLQDAFHDKSFVKKLILSLIENWNASGMEESDLTLLIPGDLLESFDKMLETNVNHQLKTGITIEMENTSGEGFKVISKNGAYFLSFTAEDFENYFMPYIKEKTRKLIFQRNSDEETGKNPEET